MYSVWGIIHHTGKKLQWRHAPDTQAQQCLSCPHQEDQRAAQPGSLSHHHWTCWLVDNSTWRGYQISLSATEWTINLPLQTILQSCYSATASDYNTQNTGLRFQFELDTITMYMYMQCFTAYICILRCSRLLLYVFTVQLIALLHISVSQQASSVITYTQFIASTYTQVSCQSWCSCASLSASAPACWRCSCLPVVPWAASVTAVCTQCPVTCEKDYLGLPNISLAMR